jgi:hypothetical protein
MNLSDMAVLRDLIAKVPKHEWPTDALVNARDATVSAITKAVLYIKDNISSVDPDFLVGGSKWF